MLGSYSNAQKNTSSTQSYVDGTNQLDEGYVHDARGNRTQDSTQGNTRHYRYGDNNRLIETVNDENGVTTQYLYNGLGQRVQKKSALGVIYYLYDEQGLLIAEANATGQIQKEYVYFEGQPFIIATADTYYYHNDHLGTPQVMTDANADIVWQANYTPFGKADVVVETITNNIRLPGQYFDKETGLHYNYHRDYDSLGGRYIQSDPIGLAGGINTYGYAYQNPINNFDPNGEEVWGITFGGGYTAKNGTAVGNSITLALDHKGNFSVLTTHEFGEGAGKGISFFGRGLFGFGDNNVNSLEGPGLSTSATIGSFSSSATLPYKYTPQDGQCSPYGVHEFYMPVVELGVGRGSGVSITYSYGVSRYKSDILGRIGRNLGRGIYDLLH
jgi:RHS repeat-associated protein